jgi:hypothetical protein
MLTLFRSKVSYRSHGMVKVPKRSFDRAPNRLSRLK